MYVSAMQRIEQVLDEGTFEEWDGNLLSGDPLEFQDSRAYTDRLKAERKKTGLSDAAITGTCLLYTSPSPRDGLLSRMPSSA